MTGTVHRPLEPAPLPPRVPPFLSLGRGTSPKSVGSARLKFMPATLCQRTHAACLLRKGRQHANRRQGKARQLASAVIAIWLIGTALASTPASASGSSGPESRRSPGSVLGPTLDGARFLGCENSAETEALDHDLESIGNQRLARIASSALSQRARIEAGDESTLSEQDLDIIQTPVEVTTTHSCAPSSKNGALTARSWGSRLGVGCWTSSYTKRQKNIFGWTLMEGRITHHHWCHNGRRITQRPDTQFWGNGSWNWRHCSTQNEFAGWIQRRWIYSGGATFRFSGVVDCTADFSSITFNNQIRGDGMRRMV